MLSSTPGHQPRIARRPFGQPRGGIGEIAPVIEPAQLLQAVIGVLARQMVERIPDSPFLRKCT